MKLVYNFCSSVYSLTIINLYVHLLPVTDGGQNNTKKSTSNTTTEKKKWAERRWYMVKWWKYSYWIGKWGKRRWNRGNDDDAHLDSVWG